MVAKLDVDKILVQLRLTRSVVRFLDHYAIEEDITRTRAIEQILREKFGMKALTWEE